MSVVVYLQGGSKKWHTFQVHVGLTIVNKLRKLKHQKRASFLDHPVDAANSSHVLDVGIAGID